MTERTQEREQAQETTQEHDVGRGTFYTLMVGVAVGSGIVGFVMPLAWGITALAVGCILIGGQAESSKAQQEQEKGAPLDKAERAGGCGLSFVLLILLAAVFFVGILGLGVGTP